MQFFKILFFSFIVLVIACDENNNQSDGIDLDSLNYNDTIVFRSGTEREMELSFIDTTVLTPKEKEYLEKQKRRGENLSVTGRNISPEKLSELLPSAINAFEKLPGATGIMFDNDGYAITTAKAEFKGNKKSITIDIFDYGKKPIIPHKAIYEVPPTDLDGVTEKVAYKNAKGFSSYDERFKQLRVELLLADRYVIVMRFTNPEMDTKDAIKILDSIDFNKIIQIGK